MPCPVCGSTSHPNKAVLEDTVEIADLDSAEQAFEAAQADFKQYELTLERQRVKMKHELDALMAYLKAIDETVQCPAFDENTGLDVKDLAVVQILTEKSVLLRHLCDERQQSLTRMEKTLEENERQSTLKNVEETKLDEIRTAIESHRRESAEKIRSLDVKSAQIETMIASIPTAYRQQKDAALMLRTQQDQLDRLNDELETLAQDAETNRNAFIDAKEKTSVAVATLETAKIEQRDAERHFHESLSAHQLSIEIYDNRKADVATLNMLKVSLESYDRQRLIVENIIKDLEPLAKSRELVDITDLEKRIEAVERNYKSDQKDREIYYLTARENETVLSKMQTILEKRSSLEAAYRYVGQLSDVMNGKNKKNMTFERYILSAYLRDILVLANERLLAMTYGRYTLHIAEEVADRRQGSGLDLEVMDQHTGLPRSVKTLSGGESFKASLALALSLSEVVQETAGGIQLDTVFIDEGFGTLDQISLESAIECLMALRESGRLVGIISHVQELKERIRTQLVITPSEQGSHASFQ
jgi:exonuclease SbcC